VGSDVWARAPKMSTSSGGGDDEGEAIQVFVRIRPLNKREIAENQTIGWNFNETSMIEDTPNGHKNYTFDRCFGPEENNSSVYERVGKNVVIKALEGYNGTVFTCKSTAGIFSSYSSLVHVQMAKLEVGKPLQ
jgi:hypothetical protein